MSFTITEQHESGGNINRLRSRPLRGMKAIRAYLGGKSENTVLKYIRNEGLPASKIGGEWVSDEVCIDDWQLNRIG